MKIEESLDELYERYSSSKTEVDILTETIEHLKQQKEHGEEYVEVIISTKIAEGHLQMGIKQIIKELETEKEIWEERVREFRTKMSKFLLTEEE